MRNIKIDWSDFILEIISVFIGITIAFAVDNWKENNEKLETELYFLNAISDDIDIILDQCDNYIERDSSSLRNADIFLNLVSNHSNHLDSIEKKNMNWIWTNHFNPPMTSFKALTSFGKLDIIKNKDLLFKILSIHSAIETMTELSVNYKDYIQTYVDPIVIKYFDADALYSDSIQQHNFGIKESIENTDIINIVKNQKFILESNLYYFNKGRIELQELKDVIGKEIRTR